MGYVEQASERKHNIGAPMNYRANQILIQQVLLLIVAVTSIFLLSNCSDSPDASQEKYIIKIAYGNQPGEPTDLGVREWARLAAEQSEGRIELQPYPASQLGSQQDVSEQVHLDNVSIWVGSARLFNKLPADIRQIIKESAEAAARFTYDQVNKTEQAALEEMQAAGVTISTPEKDLFRATVSPIYTEMFRPGLYEEVKQHIGAKE